MTLVNYDKYSPASNFPDMPTESLWLWSSTNAGLEGTNTITSSFNIGSINATIYLDPVTSTSSTINDVKCVRSEN